MKETWREKERKRGFLEKLPQIFNNGMIVSYKVLGWYIKPYPIQNYQKLQIQNYYKEKVGRKTKSRERNQKIKSSWNSAAGTVAGSQESIHFRNAGNFATLRNFTKLQNSQCLRNWQQNYEIAILLLFCTALLLLI